MAFACANGLCLLVFVAMHRVGDKQVKVKYVINVILGISIKGLLLRREEERSRKRENCIDSHLKRKMCLLIRGSEGKGQRQERRNMETIEHESDAPMQKREIVVALMNLTAVPPVSALRIASLSIRRLVRAVERGEKPGSVAQ